MSSTKNTYTANTLLHFNAEKKIQGTRFSYVLIFPPYIRIKPGWVVFESFNPDLAIVELNRRVNFVPDLINPICVPPTNKFNDIVKDAYVGGWGASQFSCDTNHFGPNPHTMCKFPFVHNGQVHQRCAKIPTPAAHNPVCAQLFRWAKNKRKLRKLLKVVELLGLR